MQKALRLLYAVLIAALVAWLVMLDTRVADIGVTSDPAPASGQADPVTVAPAVDATEAAPAPVPTPAVSKWKLLVTPYENGAAARSLAAMSLGIPAHVAERLEAAANVEPLNGTLVLTDEQAQLVKPNGKEYDLAAANRLALKRGASHFLTGSFKGQVWKWTFVSTVYAAHPDGPVLAGTSTAEGDITDLVPTGTGRMVRTNSAGRIFMLMAKTVTDAFAAAGQPLEAEVAAAIATPPTPDAFAWLKLARAYVRWFGDVATDGVADTAIGLAKVAQVIDPKHAEAQRFYATLLQMTDSPRLARIHFEFAIEQRPTDFRSLMSLGKLEMDAGNPDIANDCFGRAAASRPTDGDAQHWLGLSLLKLGKTDQAIAALEKARDIQWWHADSRKELANQYALRQRYRDAAAEMDVVANRILIGSADAVYLQAACLRAAGDREAALVVLEKAAGRFPKEARMRKFRGDLYAHMGDAAAAKREYRLAAAIDPNDRRVKALSDAKDAKGLVPLGGDALLAGIKTATDGDRSLETARAEFQMAVNDAISELHNKREAACVDGSAQSSALLAVQRGKAHHEIGGAFTGMAGRISRALANGEGAALTPDEAIEAARVIANAKRAESDAFNMNSLFVHVFQPLYRRNKCGEYDGPVKVATPEQVRKRNADRRVELPEVATPPSVMAFSPQITPEQGRAIRFSVDNVHGNHEQVLTLDGYEMGTIAPGQKMTFTALLGYHRLCLLPKGIECGAEATQRVPFLHDGWTIRVRPAS